MTGVRRELERGAFALPALCVVMVLACGVLWTVTDGTTYLYDEWVFIYWRLELTPEALLGPHNGSLNLVPLLLYQGFSSTFGLDHYWSLRALSIGFVVSCSLLLFFYLRSRVAPWVAFWPAAFLPFFGAAYWTQTSSLGLLWTIPVAAGLGALIALDRRKLRADVGACLLLVVAAASHTPGLIFVFGAAVAVSLRPPPERWTRAWIWALPMALYAAWVHWYGYGGQADLGRIWMLPQVAVESLSTVLGGITGLYRQPDAVGAARDAIETGPMEPISIALIVLVVALAVLRRLPREALVGIGLALAFWTVITVGGSETRTPTESRFLHVAAVVFLIPLACLLPRKRLSAYVPVAVGIVFLAGLASNLKALSAGADAVTMNSRWHAAGATAVELAGDRADPSFSPGNPAPAFVADVYLPRTAGSYRTLVEGRGSPALSVDELRRSDAPSRRVADRILAHALKLHLKRLPGAAPSAPDGRNCTALRSGSGREMSRSGGGTIAVANPAGAAEVRIGRFSDGTVLSLGSVSAGGSAVLSIPRARVREPWRIEVRWTRAVVVCRAPTRSTSSG